MNFLNNIKIKIYNNNHMIKELFFIALGTWTSQSQKEEKYLKMMKANNLKCQQQALIDEDVNVLTNKWGFFFPHYMTYLFDKVLAKD